MIIQCRKYVDIKTSLMVFLALMKITSRRIKCTSGQDVFRSEESSNAVKREFSAGI